MNRFDKKRSFLFLLAFLALGTLPVFLPSMGADDVPAKKAALQSPLTPAEALKHFRMTAGLRLELVACEPNVESPVAMAFAPDGKLWVVEMRDYPNGPGPGQPPAGRIRILEDRDGDGFYEHSHIFADQLLFANGLLHWRDGVLVTAAPAISHLRDTDGDGKADKKEVLYEGFAAQNPQLRVSHPNLGLDNWIYVANGLRGGQVIRSGLPNQFPVNLANLDFRFDLIHDRHEAISGLGQFGNTFDDWGQRFVCDNRHHLRHVVLENRYVRRNPFLAVPALVEDISELDDGPLSSGGKIWPLSKNWTTSTLHEGRFTAACGVYVYRGNLLPGDYQGSAFTCDPTGNLVHQEIMTPKGATFSSHPARKGVEFLATPDDWFRPVFLTCGPEGALYVVDMYRAVIEHPDFMPPELQKRPDLNVGKNKGRIWRIVPANHSAKTFPKPNLHQATTPQLVATLEHANAWQRTTAQRLLLERQDRQAIGALRSLARQSASPQARVHAAWLLQTMKALPDDLLVHLLRDQHPRVREQAVLLAERGKPSAKIMAQLQQLAGDADPRVRFQVALTLGEWPGQVPLSALAAIALRGSQDRWTRLAVASAVPNQAGALLSLVLKAKNENMINHLPLIGEFAALVGARLDPQETRDVLAALKDLGPAAGLREAPPLAPRLKGGGTGGLRVQLAGLNGLAEGLGRRGKQLGNLTLGKGDVLQAWLRDIFTATGKLAADGKVPAADRLQALRLLAHASWEVANRHLPALLDEEGSQEVRLAAVRALAAHSRPEVAPLLMKSWRSYTPAVRREVTEAMFRQLDRLKYLLDEIEAKRVKPGDIDPLRMRQLVKHGNLAVRERARRLLASSLPADRKEVLARYQKALKIKGDPHRGKEVFTKNCATCHRVAGIGIDVAPDIADSRTKTLEAFLVDIINPNQAIDNNYINYVVTTKSGKSLSGIIVTETASSITLKRAEGQTDVVLRQDVEEITSSGVSLMPEGLEKTISIAEMADLLSFLKNWRYMDGAVPVGN